MLVLKLLGGLVLIALALLLLSALKLFHDAFMRQDPGVITPDYSPQEHAIPKEDLGRFRAGRRWIESPQRDLATLRIAARDGVMLTGHLLRAKNPKALLVLVHGYHTSGKHDFALPAKYYHRMGYTLLMIDQRAHGESRGRVITFGLKERHDVQLWVMKMAEAFPDLPIFLSGLSMGATTVLMASSLNLPKAVKGIIADCAFTSPYDIVTHLMRRNYRIKKFPPMLALLSLFLWLGSGYTLKSYSTLLAMAVNTLPCLFVHGREDDFVPTYMSEQNYAACRAEKTLWLVPGAEHAVSYLSDTHGYIRRAQAFLDAHMRT